MAKEFVTCLLFGRLCALVVCPWLGLFGAVLGVRWVENKKRHKQYAGTSRRYNDKTR